MMEENKPYLALYRRWRPQTFADVVGQEHITTTLQNQLDLRKTAHSYLFTGSRGTGKTTCSKIFAKAVNCLAPVNGNPCNECSICRGIDDGSVLDVMEIDAASNNGVDDIRMLREEANFTPSVGKYRVYILDEIQMLSPSASNALLKIMEEPPPHVLFILATTDPHKILPTIISRCQRFDFKRIKAETIAARLRLICDTDKVEVTDEALLLVARLSDGGMRDSLSLLDVAISNSNGIKIDVNIITRVAGLAKKDYLFELSNAVLNQNVLSILQILERLAELSVDYERLTTQLIEHYRMFMIAKSLKQPEQIILILPEEKLLLQEQLSKLKLSEILCCIDALSITLSKMSRSHSKRIELELCLIKLATPTENNQSDGLNGEVMERLKNLENSIKNASIVAKESNHKPKETMTYIDKPKIVKEVEIFAEWTAAIEKLLKINPPLYGALLDSTAYTTEDLLLIDAPNSTFLEFIRQNEKAKLDIKKAVSLIVPEKKYRLGPYSKDNYIIKETVDTLDELEKLASVNQINVNIIN